MSLFSLATDRAKIYAEIALVVFVAAASATIAATIMHWKDTAECAAATDKLKDDNADLREAKAISDTEKENYGIQANAASAAAAAAGAERDAWKVAANGRKTTVQV